MTPPERGLGSTLAPIKWKTGFKRLPFKIQLALLHFGQSVSGGGAGGGGDGGGGSSSAYAKEAAAKDPLRAMEFFARQAAREGKWRETAREAAAWEAAEAQEAREARESRGGRDRVGQPAPSPAEVAAAATGATRSLSHEEIDGRYKLDGSRGHHLGDYIPTHEMNSFLGKCGNPAVGLFTLNQVDP